METRIVGFDPSTRIVRWEEFTTHETTEQNIESKRALLATRRAEHERMTEDIDEQEAKLVVEERELAIAEKIFAQAKESFLAQNPGQ